MTDEQLLRSLFYDLELSWERPEWSLTERVNNNLMAAVIVAELLQMPVHHAQVIKRVGRYMWTSFRPINWPDPEIIIALPGPASMHFNRVSMDFLQVRMQGPRDPRKWYQQARTAMLRFLPALQRMDASPEESNFVLEWSADIVAHMRRQ